MLKTSSDEAVNLSKLALFIYKVYFILPPMHNTLYFCIKRYFSYMGNLL